MELLFNRAVGFEIDAVKQPSFCVVSREKIQHDFSQYKYEFSRTTDGSKNSNDCAAVERLSLVTIPQNLSRLQNDYDSVNLSFKTEGLCGVRFFIETDCPQVYMPFAAAECNF